MEEVFSEENIANEADNITETEASVSDVQDRLTVCCEKKKKMPIWKVIITDICCLGAALLVFALFHHVLPRSGGFKGIVIYDTPGDWSVKWADKFTQDGSTVQTDTSYQSGNVNVSITAVNKNSVTYYVADIYISSIYNFQTALAEDTYGRGYKDTVPNLAQLNDAIIATNGDFYGAREMGVVIRNGTLYRDTVWGDVGVLYYNGIFKTYSAEDFDLQAVIDGGAYQAWSFGPSLLDENGDAIPSFDSSIAKAHPRCALGYYEPGHYCLVLVDGRQSGYSVGMSLVSLSALMDELGCRAAYNLDGGQTAVMAYMGETVNRPYEGGREVSDIVFIAEVANKEIYSQEE